MPVAFSKSIGDEAVSVSVSSMVSLSVDESEEGMGKYVAPFQHRRFLCVPHEGNT